MQGRHWVLFVVAIAVGYVLGQIWKQPAQMVGLA